jgi:two-component system, NtrC family, response regulator AtoC
MMEMKVNKVLIIDDEEGICLMLRDFLQDEGYDVSYACSPDEGMQQVKDGHPALVLLDYKMPGKSGVEVLKEIKAFDHRIVVVMVTAMKDTDTFREAKEAGATDYITKPVDLNYLRESAFISTLMSRSE